MEEKTKRSPTSEEKLARIIQRKYGLNDEQTTRTVNHVLLYVARGIGSGNLALIRKSNDDKSSEVRVLILNERKNPKGKRRGR